MYRRFTEVARNFHIAGFAIQDEKVWRQIGDVFIYYH